MRASCPLVLLLLVVVLGGGGGGGGGWGGEGVCERALVVGGCSGGRP